MAACAAAPGPMSGEAPRRAAGLPELPAGFASRMAALLGDEAADLPAALQASPVTGLRVSTLKAGPGALAARLPWPLSRVAWCTEGFAIDDPDGDAGRHPLHAAGAYSLQGPSAMAPAAVLAPEPGERVCDLAAAPGGKTTQLAARMAGRALLVANDPEPARARALLGNVERWGAPHVVVTQSRPERLARAWPEAFDRVLLDAPCSGEGMFRKSA